jgi:maltose O-acetyltransferase
VAGSDVQVGPGVQILTATHPLDLATRRARWESARPIAVGDGAWLGGGVILCPGVSIGEEAVIGAGSVVTRDIPPRVLAVGTPCRVVRPL